MKKQLTTLLFLALLSQAKAQSLEWHDVTATVYNPCPQQCNSDFLVTADNSKIDTVKLKNGEIRWIAVSRDLLSKFPYGTSVYVWIEKGHPFNGVFRVHDTMNQRYKNTIDILTYNDKYGKWNAKIQINR